MHTHARAHMHTWASISVCRVCQYLPSTGAETVAIRAGQPAAATPPVLTRADAALLIANTALTAASRLTVQHTRVTIFNPCKQTKEHPMQVQHAHAIIAFGGGSTS